jgi:alpha-galactosidase
MQFRIIGGNPDAKIWVDNQVEKDEILYFDIHMTLASEQIPEEFKVMFYAPCMDMYSVWSPRIRYERSLKANWCKQLTSSRLAHWMPLHTIVSPKGKNRVTVALSDAKTPIALRSGVREEDALMEWELVFFTTSVMPLKEYKATVRMDMRNIAYCDAIRDAVAWWENECGYVPAYVPEHARLPMNSLWYSFHQQLDVEEILKECRLSKAMGMDTVIVDDGWQTDDNGRG